MRRWVRLACGHAFVERVAADADMPVWRECPVIPHVGPKGEGVKYNPGVHYRAASGAAVSHVVDCESLRRPWTFYLPLAIAVAGFVVAFVIGVCL